MEVKDLSFGSITVDDITYDNDVVIKKGVVKKRKKGASKKYRDQYSHTPVSPYENIPWECKTLIIGTGHSTGLPVMEEVYKKARKKGVKILEMSTPEAVKHVNDRDTNLILHLTC